MHVGATSGHHPKNKRRALQSRSEMCGEAAGLQRRKRTVQLERGSEGAREEGRRRDRKRKSNLSAPQPHFYSNMRVKRRHSRSRPSLSPSLSPFLYYPAPLALPLPLPIPFHFLPLSSRHASSHLQPHLLYPLQAEQQGMVWKKKEEATERLPSLVQLPEKRVQLNDESTRKQKQLEFPAVLGDVRLPLLSANRNPSR